MESASLFYFSGTGNAKRVAEWFATAAKHHEIEFNIHSISGFDHKDISRTIGSHPVLIISPVHGFNYPKITLDFIFRFPKGKNDIYLLNTRAGMRIGKFVTPGLTGIAFMLTSLILFLKGYRIRGLIPFDMPSNWISLHPIPGKRTIEIIRKKIKERVEKHARKIFAGKKDFVALYDIVQDLLISPIALGYFFVGRFVFAKLLFANQHCNQCGLCIKQCPVNAIKMKLNHPYWTFNCESCMKCVMNCPQNAINAGHGMVVLTFWISTALTTLFYSIPSFHVNLWWVDLLIFSSIFLFVIWFVYQVQHLLLHFKWYSRLIVLTCLTFYPFWNSKQFKSNFQNIKKF